MTRFPQNIVDNTDLPLSSNFAQTIVSSPVGVGDAIINVVSTSLFPSLGAGKCLLITIDNEIIRVSASTPTTFTVASDGKGGRGFDGTAAAIHSSEVLVSDYIASNYVSSLQNEVIAIENALGINPQFPVYPNNFPAQSPGGSLTIGVNTITLSAGILGVNGTDTQHYLYISGGVGAAEAVLITGGTYTPSLGGTLIFSCLNTHSGAWTISSASGGIKEAAVILGGIGTIVLGKLTYTVYAPLIVPTTISITGQGSNSTTHAASIIYCPNATATMPGVVIADGLGIAAGQGEGVHQKYKILGPNSVGTDRGLWVGGDPNNVFAPSSWTGSYIGFRDVSVDLFSYGLTVYGGNFINFHNFISNSLVRYFSTPSNGLGSNLTNISFTGRSVLTVPSGIGCQMDTPTFQAAPVLCGPGTQVSGALGGVWLDWESWGTHYEPNDNLTRVVDVNTNAVCRVRFHGGLMSMHGSLDAAIKITTTGTGQAFVTLDSHITVQADIGLTVTNLVLLNSNLSAEFDYDRVQILAAGVFTNKWTFTGAGIVRWKSHNPVNFFDGNMSLVAGATITFPNMDFPIAPTIQITGATVGGAGITAVAGLIPPQAGSFVTVSIQTFTAGATVGNTGTTVVGLPYQYYFDGTKIWIYGKGF